MKILIKSPAKINLYLDILGKRKNGYHDILTLMQAVSLYDIIEISNKGIKDEIQISGDFSFPKKSNTITKAIDLFRQETGINTCLQINIKKNIPIGAGLGGGSSNGASVLIGLNKLFNTKIKNKKLLNIAMKIGSDVPFFINSGAAIVKGIGNEIKPVNPRVDYSVIIVFPGFSVNTKKAFDKWDELKAKSMICTDKMKENDVLAMYNDFSIKKWHFFNIFSDVVIDNHRPLNDIKDNIIRYGAAYSELSGSGSSVIGIFEDPEMAKNVVLKIREFYQHVYAAMPLEITS